MRALTTPLILSALALTACSGDDRLATAPDAAALATSDAMASAQALKPFKGRCDLIVTPLPSAPPIIRQTDTGTCQLTHLGRTAYEGVLEINLATGTQTGERTLTAANGDVLYLTSVGTSAPAGPGLVSFVATLTFGGGTGRFANATGQAQGEGLANLVTRVTTVEIEGTIAYDASDRSAR